MSENILLNMVNLFGDINFYLYLCNVNKKIKGYGELLRAIQIHDKENK